MSNTQDSSVPTHDVHNPDDPIVSNTQTSSVPTHNVHNSNDPRSKHTAQAQQEQGIARYEDPGGLDTVSTTATASISPTDRYQDQYQKDSNGDAPQGRQDQSEAQVTFMDKIIGKSEKFMGKVMENPDQKARGELRETEGKAAAGRGN